MADTTKRRHRRRVDWFKVTVWTVAIVGCLLVWATVIWVIAKLA